MDLAREIVEIAEWRHAAPQPEPLHVAELLHVGRARRGDVQHARVRQPPLELEHRFARLGPRVVLGAVGLVEGEDAVELLGQAADHLSGPLDDLIDPPLLLLVLRDERRVRAEQDAVLHVDAPRLAVRQLVQRVARDVVAAEVAQVALRVLEEHRRHRAPDSAAPPLREVVEDARRDLAPLAEAGAVADVEAAAVAALQAGTLLVALPGVHHRLQLRGGERALVVAPPVGAAVAAHAVQQRLGQAARLVRDIGRLDRSHRVALNDAGRVLVAVRALPHLVRRKDGELFRLIVRLHIGRLEHVLVRRVAAAEHDHALLGGLLVLQRRFMALELRHALGALRVLMRLLSQAQRDRLRPLLHLVDVRALLLVRVRH